MNKTILEVIYLNNLVKFRDMRYKIEVYYNVRLLFNNWTKNNVICLTSIYYMFCYYVIIEASAKAVDFSKKR